MLSKNKRTIDETMPTEEEALFQQTLDELFKDCYNPSISNLSHPNFIHEGTGVGNTLVDSAYDATNQIESHAFFDLRITAYKQGNKNECGKGTLSITINDHTYTHDFEVNGYNHYRNKPFIYLEPAYFVKELSCFPNTSLTLDKLHISDTKFLQELLCQNSKYRSLPWVIPCSSTTTAPSAAKKNQLINIITKEDVPSFSVIILAGFGYNGYYNNDHNKVSFTATTRSNLFRGPKSTKVFYQPEENNTYVNNLRINNNSQGSHTSVLQKSPQSELLSSHLSSSSLPTEGLYTTSGLATLNNTNDLFKFLDNLNNDSDNIVMNSEPAVSFIQSYSATQQARPTPIIKPIYISQSSNRGGEGILSIKMNGQTYSHEFYMKGLREIGNTVFVYLDPRYFAKEVSIFTGKHCKNIYDHKLAIANFEFFQELLDPNGQYKHVDWIMPVYPGQDDVTHSSKKIQLLDEKTQKEIPSFVIISREGNDYSGYYQENGKKIYFNAITNDALRIRKKVRLTEEDYIQNIPISNNPISKPNTIQTSDNYRQDTSNHTTSSSSPALSTFGLYANPSIQTSHESEQLDFFSPSQLN